MADERYARRLAEAPWGTDRGAGRVRGEARLSPLDVAIGGLAAQPAVATVIAGATHPEQVIANAAAGSWVPTAEDLAELNRIS